MDPADVATSLTYSSSVSPTSISSPGYLPFPGNGIPPFDTELIARPGGKGLNQALAVAHHGGKAALAAQAGNDAWGHQLYDSLAASGVNVTAFALRPGDIAAVLVQIPLAATAP